MLIKPTTVGLAVASLVLLLFDERTSGPVLGDPWRMWAPSSRRQLRGSALTIRHGPRIRREGYRARQSWRQVAR